MAFPDLWGEGTCLISIATWNLPSGTPGVGVTFSAAVNSVDIDMGDKEFETVNLIRGAQLEKWQHEADTVITFEGYPTEMDTTSTDVIQRFLAASANWDLTEPFDTFVDATTDSVTNTILSRNDFRVTLLWTDDTTVTSAEGVVPATSAALRAIFKKARLVSVKPSFTDNELKFTFKFRVKTRAKTATLGGPFETGQSNLQANVRWQSNDSSTSLGAMGGYKT